MPVMYYRTTPFPRCKYCGERMDYWIPGLPDSDHAHSGCRGRALADKAFKENRQLFEEARKLRKKTRQEIREMCTA